MQRKRRKLFALNLLDASLADDELPLRIALPEAKRVVLGRGDVVDIKVKPNAEVLGRLTAALDRDRVLSRAHLAVTAGADDVTLEVLGDARVHVDDDRVSSGEHKIDAGHRVALGAPQFRCIYELSALVAGIEPAPPSFKKVVEEATKSSLLDIMASLPPPYYPKFEARPESYFVEGGLEKIVVIAAFPELCATGGVPGHLTVLYLSDWIGRYATGIRTPLNETHLETIRRLAKDFNERYDTFDLSHDEPRLDDQGGIVLFRRAVVKETGLPFRSTDGDVLTRGHVTAPFLRNDEDSSSSSPLKRRRTLPLRLKVTATKLPECRENEHLMHVLLFSEGAVRARTAVRNARIPVTQANIDHGLIPYIPANGKNSLIVKEALATMAAADTTVAASDAN
mmetsp:Transcript_4882/g.15992  ORF Transcript_4882/g.15992 Transcript_4882/m.15992 type:complete len:396 (+) Transcript_4882:91-1278(+)